METFPPPLYDDDEYIYKSTEGVYVPLTFKDYIENLALSYNTVWTIGCPYKCIYCGNSRFIENDSNYRKIRHPSVNYIIHEAKEVLKKHPHISFFTFHDDSFISLPLDLLEEFAEKWKSKISKPFSIQGVIPAYVKEDKLKVLLTAGMNRVRMGIQSGSSRILKFYKRPDKPGLSLKATSIIASFSDYMIPPAYDIIVDNPIETKQDVIDTLDLLYNIKRPYTLNVYALKVIPNTEMEREFVKRNIDFGCISENYVKTSKTLSNALIYILATFKIPNFVYLFLLQYVMPASAKQRRFPIFIFFCRSLYLGKRFIDHMRFMDFSVVMGKVGYILWKFGILDYYEKGKKKYKP